MMAGGVRLVRSSWDVTGLPSNLAPVWSSLDKSSAIKRLRASAFWCLTPDRCSMIMS